METAADPPSLQQVFQVLQNAVSQDPAVAQVATAELDRYKTIPGFFQTVQIVAAERTVALDIRKMAIFHFKNNTPSLWRRSQLYPEPVKQNMRARMFSFFDEPDDIVARTNAIAVAKIARIDYPRAWPDFDSQLIDVITTNMQAVYASPNPSPQNMLVLQRALILLNQVLKELTVAKVPVLTTAVLNLVRQLQETLLAVYRNAAESFAAGLSPANLDTADKLYHIRNTHLAFKCLIKGMIFLWQRSRVKGFDGAEQAVEAFFNIAVPQFVAFSDLRINLFASNLPANLIDSRTQHYLSHHVRTYGKYFRKTQIFSTTRFVKLPRCRELVFYYWDKVLQSSNAPTSAAQDSDTAVWPVRFLTQALSIFKDAVAQWSPSRQPDNQDVLPREFVEGAVQLIVTRLLLLAEEDLEQWSEDPEEWINLEESDSDAWEYGVRPCAERVLMTLASQYGDYVVPLIKTYIEQVATTPAQDLPSVLRKEALYCAVGRCAHRLKDTIQFDVWLNESLAQEALDPRPTYRIIKRRIAWLFGRWFSESSISTSKAKVYEVLVQLMQAQGEGSDAVVRLTAATALRDCVDSISFDAPTFSPYIPAAIGSLLNLMAEAESQDAKKRVVRSLNVIVGAVQQQIVPFLADIVGPVTILWQHPDLNIALRAELMTTVTDLVKASKEHSAPLAPISAILINECLKPELRVQMEEDAITLWLITLRNSIPNDNPANPDLFQLLPTAVQQLATNLDLLGKICQVMESYVLLDCNRVLQLQALPLHQAYSVVYKDAMLSNIKDMLSLCHLMVQISPSSFWAEAMHASGFFAQLLASVIEDKSKSDNTLVLVEVLQLFARIIMVDSSVFLRLMEASAGPLKKTPEWLMVGFLDQWWNKFDNIIDAPRRKLVALATAELLATGNREVIERLSSSEPFNIWLDVLGELKEALNQQADEDGGDDNPLIRFWKDQDELVLPDRFEEVEDTLEMERRQRLFKQDPIRRIPLKEFIGEKMGQAQAAAMANGVDFQAALGKVDQTTIEALQKGLK